MKEDVWVMIGEGTVMVIRVVKGEMFWTGATWEIEEKSGVEDSKDGKWRLTAGSGEEETKTFSVPDVVDKVTEGRCRVILKIGTFEIAGSDMEVLTAADVIVSWLNSIVLSVDTEVSITVDTKEDVWAMIWEGMVMVI